MSNQPLPQPTPYQQTFLDIANRSFDIQPYPWQYGMGGFAIQCVSNNHDFKFICIRPTGGGKSLLYQVLALYLKGVTLCITPILALGSDQMRKVLQIPDRSVTAFHMDELNDPDVLKLKRHLEVLHPEDSVIILASPLFLNNRGKQFVSFLHQRNLIKLVVMDELHLSHHFARSFRDDFDKLKSLIFNRLPRNLPCIFMTATCSQTMINMSERIFGFRITHKDWPTVKEMANRKQAFVATYTPLGIRYIQDIIEQHLGMNAVDGNGRSLPDKMMFYGNTRSSIKALAEKLELFLDSKDDLNKYDVLVIHGHQSKEEKSAFLKHFSTCTGENMNFKIVCATSGVANAGIDCKDIRFVFRLDIPPSIWDLAQEMGRAGRGSSASSDHYTYFLFFQLKNVIYLYSRIHDPDERCNDRSYRDEQCKDLLDVVGLLANGKTCHKQLIELAMGNPVGDRRPFPPCGKCSVCRDDVEMWPSLCKEGVRLVVFDVFAGGNAINGKYTMENVGNAICNYQDSMKHLFSSRSKKKPSSGLVNKMLFLLIGAGMISLEYVNETENEKAHVVLCLAKVSALNPQRRLMIDSPYWDNIILKDPIVDYNN